MARPPQVLLKGLGIAAVLEARTQRLVLCAQLAGFACRLELGHELGQVDHVRVRLGFLAALRVELEGWRCWSSLVVGRAATTIRGGGADANSAATATATATATAILLLLV